ncbi:peptide ABC transporter substrate-binding protein [Alphaproteobacteria bacterium]|nr:peptide ABC transporter substrate-binding protein [Alphaproteobacteria bacterium]
MSNNMLFLSRRRFLIGSSALAVGATLTPTISPAWGQGTPKRGGTVTLLATPEPPTLVSAASSTGTARLISPKVNEGLLDYDFDLSPRPQLATSWSISPDGLEYAFKLRPGVKWHDGEDFTSKDVAFSIEFLKQNHTNGRNTFANVTEIRTPDPLTAIIVLSKPAPYLITALAAQESPIIAKHVYEGQEPLTAKGNVAPIGTGPFIFKEWVRGSHVLFERNPNYWDQPKPYIDVLIVRFISDPAAKTSAIEAGSIDLAGESPVPLSDVERFRNMPHIGIETRGSEYVGDINQMMFNLENPILKNLDVRRAFAHAIDKKVVQNIVWYGYARITNGPIIPSLKPFYADDLPVYDFSVKKAEDLLDKAGHPRAANGVRFRLVHDFLPYGENYKRGSEYIKQALAKIGVEIELRAQDFPTYIKRVYTDGDYAFVNASLPNYYDPTPGVARLFWSKNIKKGVPFSNGAHYVNPEVDRLLEAAAFETDKEKRIRYFHDFQHIIVQELPHLDLVETQPLTFYNKRIRNHTLGANGIRSNLADLYIES